MTLPLQNGAEIRDGRTVGPGELVDAAGIAAVGGRTPSEIADRFLEQAALANGSGSHERAAEILRAYLAIRGTVKECAGKLEAFAKNSGLDISEALDAFKNRLDAIVAKGLNPAGITFSADFGRRLDFYTGFVFEIHSRKRDAGGQLVGGGRYDRLVKLLGADREVPAIGFSIWLDRVAKISGRNA